MSAKNLATAVKDDLLTCAARALLHVAYVLLIPVIIVAVFVWGFFRLLKVEEYEGGLVLTIYGSPVDVLLAGAAASPLVVISYLAYWLMRVLFDMRK